MPRLGVTGAVSESKQFEWKIDNFLSLSSVKDAVYSSPSFEFSNTSLHLDIYPTYHNVAGFAFLSVFIVNETGCPLGLSYSLHIKKADGMLIGDKSGDISLKTDWGYRVFYSRSDLVQNKAELLPSGILTIVCILKSKQDGKQDTKEDENAEMSASKTSDYRVINELDVLSENLRDLSVNKDSCDVVLEVEDKEFKAHKLILMARSSVFAAMFQHDTLEKQTGFIKIPDCDSESFQEFLDYMYRGKLEDVTFRSAFHLYSTWNKYDVQKLKEFCMEYLIQSLSSDNICDIAKLADTYDEVKLMTETQDFFNKNWNKIFPTTEWQNFLKNNFRLANKFLIELSKTKDSQ